jgi:hypothetical protein
MNLLDYHMCSGGPFEYIEAFYNRKRRHEHLGGMSQVEFEQKKLVAYEGLRNWGNSTQHRHCRYSSGP